jgi:hypothetical protein
LGRQAGLDLNNGQVINNVPNAFVSENGVDPQIIMLPQIVGQYQVQGIGVTPGNYTIGALRAMTDTNPVIIRTLTGTTTVGQSFQYTFGQPSSQESNGQVILEAEQTDWQIGRSNRSWLTQTVLAGYSGASYLNAPPDTGLIFTPTYTATSPELRYSINFTTTGTYYTWLRGYASNGGGDSVYVSLNDQPAATLTGFAPRQWSWANSNASQGGRFTIQVTTPGLHTLHIWQREDGLRLDRILLTTNSSYIPSGNGPN